MNHKLNKYEKRIMLNLHVITFVCIIAISLNIILPLMENYKLTLFLVSQVIPICAIYIYGWVNSRNAQNIPIAVTFIIRSLQALIFIYWKQNISWSYFNIILFFDVLLIVILVLDKSNYRYEYVSKEDNEFE